MIMFCGCLDVRARTAVDLWWEIVGAKSARFVGVSKMLLSGREMASIRKTNGGFIQAPATGIIIMISV